MIKSKSTPTTQNAQRKLLRAAADTFAASGFDPASIRTIGGRAGVNMALIAYHFGGKDGLYDAVLSDWMNGLRTGLDSALQDVSDPASRTAALVTAFLRYTTFEARGSAALVARESILAGPSTTTQRTAAALGPVRELLDSVLPSCATTVTDGAQCLALLLRLGAPMPSIEDDADPAQHFDRARNLALSILLPLGMPEARATKELQAVPRRSQPTLDFVD